MQLGSSTSVIHPTIRISLPMPSLQPAYPAPVTLVSLSTQPVHPVIISNLPVESPLSTASQQGTNDPYHMQILSTACIVTTAMWPSTMSIREIHVNLPLSVQEKDINMEYPDSLQRKRHPSSTITDTVTLSLTPSMLEQDSQDGSIKCVCHPLLTPPSLCLSDAPC